MKSAVIEHNLSNFKKLKYFKMIQAKELKN